MKEKEIDTDRKREGGEGERQTDRHTQKDTERKIEKGRESKTRRNNMKKRTMANYLLCTYVLLLNFQ